MEEVNSTDLRWLRALARSLLRSEDAAEDLVQDTVVAALAAPAPSEAPRRAWLAGIARRLAARSHRSDARRMRREARAARAEALPDDVELHAQAEMAEHVLTVVRQLPEPYRRAILLRFLEGLDAHEIARREQRAIDTVRYRVRRGLELVREELARRHGKDWKSIRALFLPLARPALDGAALASKSTAAASLPLSVPLLVLMKTNKFAIAVTALLLCCGTYWFLDSSSGAAEQKPQAPAEGDTIAAEVTPGDDRSRTGTRIAADDLRIAKPAASKSIVKPDAGLRGRVLDPWSRPIVGASVYVARRGLEGAAATVLGETTTDAEGVYRLDCVEPSELAELVLGAWAKGFLRNTMTQLDAQKNRAELDITLRAGASLRGRVVDESGRPVPNVAMIASLATAGIEHVSPSQVAMRAARKRRGLDNRYQDCSAVTDANGAIEFHSLPAGELEVRSLDAAWVLEKPRVVVAASRFVEWVARRSLGVRLEVLDGEDGRRVSSARATFNVELDFEDGGSTETGQWVGRGRGVVSFGLTPALVPELAKRRVKRVTFYGTVGVKGGVKQKWRSRSLTGAFGVVEARVLLDVEAREEAAAAVPKKTAQLDVRYADGSPFEGSLRVSWRMSGAAGKARRGAETARRSSDGRFRIELPIGDLSLEVRERSASGSLPAWVGRARNSAESEAITFVALPRGATVVVKRPAEWTGQWFVRASFRDSPEGAWRGSWGYGTTEETLTLSAVKPAQWRYELRRRDERSGKPVLRIAQVAEGRTTIVE